MYGDFSKIGRDVSVLYRLMKMYYERELSEFEIGWGQQFYLVFIYENPGVTPQQLADFFHVDKATITKVIKKLLQIEYIKVETAEQDRRVHQLFASESAFPAVERVRHLHQEFYEVLIEGMPEQDVRSTEDNLEKMIQNIRKKVRHRMEETYDNRK